MAEIILDMVFSDDNLPDFGSMDFDNDKDVVLLGIDIDKLNTLLTRTVCVDTYHANEFCIKNGTFAHAVDVTRLFRYHSKSDKWYEQEK